MDMDDSLTLEAAFSRAFVHACYTGELSKIQESLASGRVTAEDLDIGEKDGLAT
jgi:hypothetical protein